MEKIKIDFNKEYDTLLKEIEEIEYFKANKLTISVGKDHWKEEVQSDLADDKGNFIMKRVDANGYRLNLKKGSETVYSRTCEGDTLESRYLVLYYTYRDILNAGLQLMHLTFVEQKKMLDEIAKMHMNLKPGQKIIA